MSDSAPSHTPDQEWEELLRQWRTQSNSGPQPFFYTRVRARLLRETAAGYQPLRAWLRWPRYALLLGIILLLSGDAAVAYSAEAGHLPSAASHDQPVAFPTR